MLSEHLIQIWWYQRDWKAQAPGEYVIILLSGVNEQANKFKT